MATDPPVKSGTDPALEAAADALLDNPEEHGILTGGQKRTTRYREMQMPEFMVEFQVRDYHCKACQLRDRIATRGH